MRASNSAPIVIDYEQSKSLLQHSDLSLAQIAIRVGFADQSHFSRYFKRRVGVTPRQFQGRSQ